MMIMLIYNDLGKIDCTPWDENCTPCRRSRTPWIADQIISAEDAAQFAPLPLLIVAGNVCKSAYLANAN